MPLNRPAEPLAPGPRGAVQARRWVVGVCGEIGRPDLTENAELALSEVVTNAILHGRPPMTVRLRGTVDHPRVEVRDQSQLHHGNQGHTATIHTAGLFLKAISALVGPGEGIALRKLDRRNDHEVELAVVIGKEAKDVSRQDALGHVAGYAIGLDITIRGPEERSLRKSPDSYAVLGPWLVTPDEIADPGDLDLRIAVNGEERQNSNTRYMILGVAQLIEYASSFYTLYPGDIIITGTPEGVSPIQPGDVISAYVECIGTMEVKVRAA